MELFFSDNIKNGIIKLSPEESRHCIKVLRHKAGDLLHIIDGKGNMYEAELIDDNPKGAVAEIKKVTENFGIPDYFLHVALAPLKNPSRYETFLEKATEIGISSITPVLTRYTEKKTFKTERYRKILLSAIKQSLRAKLPELNEAVKFEKFVKQCKEQQKFIALCNADKKLIDVYDNTKDTVVLIGPEGGFSEEEKKIAQDNGFIPVLVGSSRLRAETAAIVTVSIISNKNLKI